MASSILSLSRPVVTKAPRAPIGSKNLRSWRASTSSAYYRNDGAGCVISPPPRLSHDDVANSSRRETHRFCFTLDEKKKVLQPSFYFLRVLDVFPYPHTHSLTHSLSHYPTFSQNHATCAAGSSQHRHLLSAAAARGGGARGHAAAAVGWQL